MTAIAAREWIDGESDEYDLSSWCRWCGKYRVVVRCPLCNERRDLDAPASFRVMAHDSMFNPPLREIRWAEFQYAYGDVVRYSPMRHVAVLLYLHGFKPMMRANTWETQEV